MTPLTRLLLFALLLGACPCLAGTITVTPETQTVETSRLKITWNTLFPEIVQYLYFKDYSANVSVATSSYTNDEYWGESTRGLNSPGYFNVFTDETHVWQVTKQTPSLVQLTITSQSGNQPAVATTYTILADKPYFGVERTILFSTFPDTASYQAYVPRVNFLTPYHALRWRDHTGTLVERGFCIAPCLVSDWDGHWMQFLTRGGAGQLGLGITSIYPPGSVAGLSLVRGTGPGTFSGWAQPRIPAGTHDTDISWDQLVSFSTAPDDLTALDQLYASYASGAAFADVPPATSGGKLRLEVAPNPVRGPARLAWNDPVAGEVSLDVLDIAGRRVARLLSGTFAAGAQRTTWDGRGSNGARVAPGLYLARLVTPAGTCTATIVRAN